jgi:hypothetical protein
MVEQVRLDTSFFPAWPPALQRNAMAAAPWSLHLADGRGRVGQAAALGPEGGRLALLPERPGRPAPSPERPGGPGSCGRAR